MQVANLIFEAACGMTAAAEKIEKSVRISIQLEAMKSANLSRAVVGASPAYTEEAFEQLAQELD